MADALPLILWNRLRYDMANRRRRCRDHQLHSIHQCSLVHTVLDELFFTAATRYHSPPPRYFPFSQIALIPHTLLRWNLGREPVLALGAGTYKCDAKYVPLFEEEI
ncbi:hypothetical protein F4604DRAFT_714544 [Suillus subluteus]|nr:hypothetical protein F4604DRAFT_714544 [Suillus subluteus]